MNTDIAADIAAQVASLRQICERIKAQLDDPRTPPYSVAPLANQLRLAESGIARLLKPPPDEFEGLPVTPEQAGFADFLAYQSWCRQRDHDWRQEGDENPWVRRQREIFERWFAAGFVLPDRADYSTDETEELWRAELIRRLESANTGGGENATGG